jgi:AhpD family alkylhydroperoxidase
MENQVQLNEERTRLRSKFAQVLPTLMTVEQSVVDEVYKDGALSTKAKRIMSMAVALAVGCTNCILSQTNSAIEAGATNEEILEALKVVVSMRGTTGIGESLRVIKLLEELGKL